MKLTILVPIIGLVVVAGLVGVLVVSQAPPQGGVIENAIENSLALDFLSSKLEIQVADSASASNFLVSLDSSLDKANPETWLSDSQLVFDVNVGGQELAAALDLKAIGKILYVKINSLSGAALPFVDESVLAFFKEQWIKIDTDELKETVGDAYASSQAMNLEQAKLFLDQLSALFKDKTVLQVEKELPAEAIDGNNAKHYLVSIDKDALKELVPEYLDLAEEFLPEDQLAAYMESKQEVIDQAMIGIDELWLRLGSIEFDAWVTTKGDYLKKIKFEKNLETITVNLELTLSDFDEPVSIEAPASSISVNDLISLFMTEASGLLPEDIGEITE